MKNFEFSLARIYNYKNQLLDREKSTLFHLHSQRNELEQQLDQARQSLEDLNRRIQIETARGVTAIDLRTFDLQLDSGRRYITRLLGMMEAMNLAIERQLKVVVAASQEVSGMEKLEEKQRTEYNQALAKADERVISEFVSADVIRKKQRADQQTS